MNRHLAAVAGAVVLAAAAIVVSLGHHDRPEPARAVTAPAHASTAGSKDQAVDAALAIASAPQQWLYLSDDDIRAAVDRLATPEASPRLAADAVTAASAARDSLQRASGPVWWLVQPLAWKVDAFDGRAATVTIWELQILSARDIAAPQSAYRFATIDLTWTEGRWLATDVTDSDGPAASPTPGTVAADSRSFDDALGGFTRVGEDS